jgi:hypothetical protein
MDGSAWDVNGSKDPAFFPLENLSLYAENVVEENHRNRPEGLTWDEVYAGSTRPPDLSADSRLNPVEQRRPQSQCNHEMRDFHLDLYDNLQRPDNRLLPGDDRAAARRKAKEAVADPRNELWVELFVSKYKSGSSGDKKVLRRLGRIQEELMKEESYDNVPPPAPEPPGYYR